MHGNAVTFCEPYGPRELVSTRYLCTLFQIHSLYWAFCQHLRYHGAFSNRLYFSLLCHTLHFKFINFKSGQMTGFHTKKRKNMGIRWVTSGIYYTYIYVYLNNLWLHKFLCKVLLLKLFSPRKPEMLGEQLCHVVFKLCSLIRRTFNDFFKSERVQWINQFLKFVV